MSHRDELKNLFSETLRLAEQSTEIAEQYAALRKAATDKGFDWSQIKSLANAAARDGSDGGERVHKLIRKADFAGEYARMLGLGEYEQETQSRSSSPEEMTGEQSAIAAHNRLYPGTNVKLSGDAPPDDLEIPGFLRRTEGASA